MALGLEGAGEFPDLLIDMKDIVYDLGPILYVFVRLLRWHMESSSDSPTGGAKWYIQRRDVANI